ncbi:hypothetical protein Tco_0272008 [Tanacetum coccineum]
MFEDNSYKAHEVYENLFEAMEKSLEHDYSNKLPADVDEARGKKGKRCNSPRTSSRSPPSQPPPPAGECGAPGTSRVLGSSQLPPPPPPPSTGTAQQQGNSLMNDHSIPGEQIDRRIRKVIKSEVRCQPTTASRWSSKSCHYSNTILLQKRLGVFEIWQQGKQAYTINLQDEVLNMVYLTGGSIDRNSILTDMILRRVEEKSEHTYGFSVSSASKPTQDTGHLDHLPSSDKHMLSTAVKLWTQNLFSDGTLTLILEALDYIVKEFKIKRLNLGMNKRFWTQKDVTRSKEFIAAIEKRLKTRRIYRNLECFVGGTDFFIERDDIAIPLKRI